MSKRLISAGSVRNDHFQKRFFKEKRTWPVTLIIGGVSAIRHYRPLAVPASIRVVQHTNVAWSCAGYSDWAEGRAFSSFRRSFRYYQSGFAYCEYDGAAAGSDYTG